MPWLYIPTEDSFVGGLYTLRNTENGDGLPTYFPDPLEAHGPRIPEGHEVQVIELATDPKFNGWGKVKWIEGNVANTGWADLRSHLYVWLQDEDTPEEEPEPEPEPEPEQGMFIDDWLPFEIRYPAGTGTTITRKVEIRVDTDRIDDYLDVDRG